jgi:predicted transcriptional regulator
MTNMATLTGKQEALKVIEKLPEDASLDEILRELAFARMVERGLEDSEHGRTISHQEMAQRLDSWAK